MSHVTAILLCTAVQDGEVDKDEHPNADSLSAWLVENYGEANGGSQIASFHAAWMGIYFLLPTKIPTATRGQKIYNRDVGECAG